jgi:putative ABC transport system permease protein
MVDGSHLLRSDEDLAELGAGPAAGGRAGSGLNSRLAWRNLVHDRARFVVTLLGIVFSVVLMAVQGGLLVGFAETAGSLVSHAGADFWVVSRGTSNVDQSVTMPERRRFRLLEIPGVRAVDKLLVRFAEWRRPDGGSESVGIVGFDLDRGIGIPWNVEPGALAALHQPDAVLIDRLYAGKLGVSAPGQSVEIRGLRARVVGFTDGIRAFTQSPYVFTSYDNAVAFSGVAPDRTSYLLVTAKPGADYDAIARRLRQALPMADVHTSSQFALMSARYWLLTTGAGVALVAGALLGLIVGVIIVAQTLYAATVERLSEYATLRAMGASNGYLNAIVIKQAVIAGAFGSCIGLMLDAALVHAAANSNVSLVLPWPLAALIALITLVMCAGASAVAIDKIRRAEPTMVFR